MVVSRQKVNFEISKKRTLALTSHLAILRQELEVLEDERFITISYRDSIANREFMPKYNSSVAIMSVLAIFLEPTLPGSELICLMILAIMHNRVEESEKLHFPLSKTASKSRYTELYRSETDSLSTLDQRIDSLNERINLTEDEINHTRDEIAMLLQTNLCGKFEYIDKSLKLFFQEPEMQKDYEEYKSKYGEIGFLPDYYKDSKVKIKTLKSLNSR
ncbi:MAG: hypothetical protein PHD02_00455 [Bacilli bacterium]|nr:hypothetical protein [Bacilli bacterium]